MPDPAEHHDATDDPDDVATLGYAAAVAELDAILVEIDHDEVDLDHLATRMRRAAALIDHCRGRIADARVDVERVAADLTALDLPRREDDDVE